MNIRKMCIKSVNNDTPQYVLLHPWRPETMAQRILQLPGCLQKAVTILEGSETVVNTDKNITKHRIDSIFEVRKI